MCCHLPNGCWSSYTSDIEIRLWSAKKAAGREPLLDICTRQYCNSSDRLGASLRVSPAAAETEERVPGPTSALLRPHETSSLPLHCRVNARLPSAEQAE